MQPLIDNARTFGQRPEEFAKLTDGQSPEVTGAVREHRVDADSFEAL